MTIILITRVEEAINRCKHAQPPIDYVLGPDLRVLATIWGLMIAHHLSSLDLEAQPESDRMILQRWLIPTDVEVAGLARSMPNSDPGDDWECAACQ
jgi:hypothetical protein